MYLVQILLPLVGRRETAERIKRQMTEKFGGVTAFTRAPAEGLWAQGGRREEDDIAVVEVMTETLDKDWWRAVKERLEADLQQQEIVIRASEIVLL